jgi:manganese/iron transport system permease protein
MADWLTDPLDYRFMRLALLEVVIVGAVAGMLGTYIVLRGLAFVSEAISHSVFPGVVIAFLVDVSIFAGGAAFGLMVALAISSLSRSRQLREDTAIGVVFAGSLALGVVLISTSPGYTRDLTALLFGDVLATTATDVYVSLTVGVLAAGMAVALRRVLLIAAFDREMALAMGLPLFKLDTLLLVLVTLTIVVALRAVGNVLVLAMFVTPAATARLLVNDVGRMMALSSALGAGSGVLGLYLSWHTDLAAGGMVVLTATVIFLAAFLFSPRQGLLRSLARRRRAGGSAAAGATP